MTAGSLYLSPGDERRASAIAALGSFGHGARATGLATLAAFAAPNPLVIGLISASGYIPWLLLGPWAGYLVDSRAKKTIMVITSLAACLIAGAGLFMASIMDLHWFIILLISVALGAANVVDDTAINSYVAQEAGPERIAPVNAIMSSWQSFAGIIAPLVAGVVVGIGPEWIFILVIGIFGGVVAVATTLDNVGVSKAIDGSATEKRSLRPVGFSKIRAIPALFSLSTGVAGMNIYSGLLSSLLPIYILSNTESSTQQVGLAFAVQSVTLLAGVIWAARLMSRWNKAILSLLRIAAWIKVPVFILLVCFPGNIFALLSACSLNGLSAGMWNAPSSTVLMKASAGDKQTHIIAAYKTIATLGAPLGALLGGVIAAATNVSAAFLCALVLAVIVATIITQGVQLEAAPSAKEDVHEDE